MFVPRGFWGAVVKKGQPYELDVEPGAVITVTGAALAGKPGKDRHVVTYNVEDTKFVLCTLTSGVIDQVPLKLKFAEETLKLAVEQGNGEVHLSGYFETLLDSDDEDDMEEEDEDSQDEVVRRNTLINQLMTTGTGSKRKIPITDGTGAKKAKTSGNSEEDEDDDDDEEYTGMDDSVASGDFDDDDDDDDEDDGEGDSEEANAKHVAFGAGSSEDDDSADLEDGDEEEKPAPKPRHEKTKVQRQQTPGKPQRQPDSTPKAQMAGAKGGKVAGKTPQTDIKKIKCPDCPKTFNVESGMQQHRKAVHKSG